MAMNLTKQQQEALDGKQGETNELASFAGPPFHPPPRSTAKLPQSDRLTKMEALI